MAQVIDYTKAGERPLLTWAEVEKILDLGFAVELPEFKGWWFKEKGVILVRTRNGEITKTPWIETYKDRTDWRISMQTMDFSQALRFAMNDVPTFRTHYNALTGKQISVSPLAKKKYIKTKEDVLYDYKTNNDDFFLEDLTSEDWIMTLRDARRPGDK